MEIYLPPPPHVFFCCQSKSACDSSLLCAGSEYYNCNLPSTENSIQHLHLVMSKQPTKFIKQNYFLFIRPPPSTPPPVTVAILLCAVDDDDVDTIE